VKSRWIFLAGLALGLLPVAVLTLNRAPNAPVEVPAQANPLTMAAAERTRLGIVVAPASTELLSQVDTVPAEVKADQYRVAEVAARVKSQVVTRFAKLGDRISRGAPLVTLSSTEMADAHGQLVLAAQEWRRMRALGPEIVSRKRYEEAEVGLAGARARVEAFGMSAGDAQGLSAASGAQRANGRYTLYAPQAGTVLSDDFVLGQDVEPGKVLFQLADEEGLWVEAQVSPDHAQNVSPETQVEIVPNDGGKPLLGTVLRTAPTVTEATRTRAVRIRVDNSLGRLHIGDAVSVRLQTAGATPALVVPEAAIVLLNGAAGVFVLSGDTFEFRPLDVDPATGGRSVVKRGLARGEQVATAGAFALKARVLKGTLTDTD
jgi:cobalt-zinc-cadmium efflux system membrane fusion protein